MTERTNSPRAVRLAVTGLTAICATVMAWSQNGFAQQEQASSYPERPIKLVVGMSTGGGNDLLSRLVARYASEKLGQPIVVENRVGAGGTIAAEFVARAAPDGHTLLMAPAGTLTINPAVYSKLPYDSIKSFAPVSLISTYPFLLSVNASGSIKTLDELLSFARAHPEKANYGSTSAIYQLTTELFNSKAEVRFELIPFKGGSEVVAAILNNQITMAFADASSAIPQVKSGKLRPIAVSSARRMPQLPDVPTIAELGVKGVDSEGYSGIVAPKGTPEQIIRKLESTLVQSIAEKQFAERLDQLGMVPASGTAEELRAIIARDIPRFTAVAKAANIKLD